MVKAWVEDKTLAANQGGFRLLDLNNDGICELISKWLNQEPQ